MTERPKRNAVANRKATDKLLDNRKCRSSAQVQQEKETAAATAAASLEKKNNLASQKKLCVAAFEDLLRKEDQQHDKKKARPDLLAACHPVNAYLWLFVSLSPIFMLTEQGKPTPKQWGFQVKASTNVTVGPFICY